MFQLFLLIALGEVCVLSTRFQHIQIVYYLSYLVWFSSSIAFLTEAFVFLQRFHLYPIFFQFPLIQNFMI